MYPTQRKKGGIHCPNEQPHGSKVVKHTSPFHAQLAHTHLCQAERASLNTLTLQGCQEAGVGPGVVVALGGGMARCRTFSSTLATRDALSCRARWVSTKGRGREAMGRMSRGTDSRDSANVSMNCSLEKIPSIFETHHHHFFPVHKDQQYVFMYTFIYICKCTYMQGMCTWVCICMRMHLCMCGYMSMYFLSYLSHSLADRWGTTTDFTTIFLHSSQFLAFRSRLFHSTPVHS